MARNWEPDIGLSPLHRQAHFNASIGPYIVSMCGYICHGSDNYEFRQPYIHYYDIFNGTQFLVTCEADTSSRLYDLNPFSLSSPAGCCVNDSKVYLFGGFSLHIQFAVNELIEVDFVIPHSPVYRVIHGSGRNANDKPAPLPRDKASMVHWKNKLFVFGGYGIGPEEVNEEYASNYLMDRMNFQNSEDIYGWNNQLLIYNLLEKEWSVANAGGNVPSPRAAHSACAIDNHMYVFGGRVPSDGSSSIIRVNDLFALNMTKLQWTKIHLTGELPCGRSWMSFTKLRDSNEIIVYGGQNTESDALDDVYVIQLDENKSRKIRNLQEHSKRLWHSACCGYDGLLYVTGGISVGPYIQEGDKHWSLPALEIVSVGSPPSLQTLCFSELLKRNCNPIQMPNFFLPDWYKMHQCFAYEKSLTPPNHLAGH